MIWVELGGDWIFILSAQTERYTACWFSVARNRCSMFRVVSMTCDVTGSVGEWSLVGQKFGRQLWETGAASKAKGPKLQAEIGWPSTIPLPDLACNHPWKPYNIEPRVDYLSHVPSSPIAVQWMQDHLLGFMMNSVGHTKSDMLCSDTIALENHSDWCWHWSYLYGRMWVFENLGHMQFLYCFNLWQLATSYLWRWLTHAKRSTCRQ